MHLTKSIANTNTNHVPPYALIYLMNLPGLNDNGCAGPLVRPLALALNISTKQNISSKQQAQTVTSPTAQQLLR